MWGLICRGQWRRVCENVRCADWGPGSLGDWSSDYHTRQWNWGCDPAHLLWPRQQAAGWRQKAREDLEGNKV